MPSGSSPARDALEGYVAGRLKPERLVIAVAAAYYGAQGGGGDGARGGDARTGEDLREVIDVIDRASPGIVELASVAGGPGFDVRLAERPFPTQYEAELRRAAAAVLARPGVAPAPPAPPPGPRGASSRPPLAPPLLPQSAPPAPPATAAAPAEGGLVVRLARALRRLFSASA
jgi:hypothetical protein